MSSYISIPALKGYGSLNIQGAMTDVELRRIAESVSDQVDMYTGRHFGVENKARVFNGGGWKLKVPDLIAVSSLKTDDDLDRIFETTWAATDYLLSPDNADPATRSNRDSQPYYMIEIDFDAGSKSSFPWGRRAIEVTGRWGYWEHLRTATETMDVISSTTAVAVTVDAIINVEVGMTILIDTEQMYVEESTGVDGFTVRRGVNGTTAATHLAGATIQIYEYPPMIVEATLAQTMRLFRRGITGYAAASALDGGGVFPGLDRDVMQMINPYRLWSF